jgi:hypothetical protein
MLQRLLRVLAAVIAAACVAATTASAASSGGATVGSTVGSPAPAPQPTGAAKALSARGMWIWYVSQSNGGDLSSIISTSHRYGISTLLIKAGDGTGAWSQFNSSLISTLHSAGISVCAWQYVYGNNPIGEANVGAQAVHAGADCLVIDAEAEYEGKYVQAQQYVKRLRQLIGANYPLALAGFPYVDYHPSFPYSVFLGPGGAQNNAPQMYWPDIQVSPDTVFSHTYEFNLPFGRPIEPLGETSGNPPPGQIMRFRQLSRAYGAPNVSWWDWQETSSRDWGAIAQPIGNLSGAAAKPNPQMPTLSVKSQHGISSGDLVVWAQEHLMKAGARITIDGGFGPKTRTAVESFQTSHGLSPTGVIDAVTWRALLRYPPETVTWTSKGAHTSAARGSLLLQVPSSSRIPTRRYEIPPHLGAGRGPR